MLIKNNGTNPITMNLRDGSSYVLQPGVPTSVPDATTTMIDDSSVLIALFNAGTLVAYTDSGSAYPGFPTSVNVSDVDASKVYPMTYKGGTLSPDSLAALAGSGVATVIDASIAAAAASNSVINKPWSKAPSWAPNTNYYQGTVVRGIGAGNTENLYVNCATGVSAASTGPTGRGSAGIIDNTCAWLFIGTGVADSTVPLWSTVTPAASTDVMDGYLAIVTNATLATLGLTRYYEMAYTNSVARITGGVLTNTGGRIDVQAPNMGTLASPSRPASAKRWCAHMHTDSRKWLAIYPEGAIYPSRIAIEVNGRMLTEGQIGVGTTTASGAYLLDMSRFPAGTKDIRVYGLGEIRSSVFRVYVADDELLWKPSTRNNLVLAWEADSIGQGGGLGPTLITEWVESLVCRQLGIESWYNNAIGSTGAISTGLPAGTRTTYLDRLDDLVAVNPDIIVIGGFHNDVGYTQDQQRTAFLTYLRAVRAKATKATIFLTGAQSLQGESLVDGAGTLYQLELNTKWAFDQFADSNSCFIPLLTRADKFPNVSTNGWFYQNGGAAPFNDGHPVPRYYRSFAQIVVEAIKAWFATH